MKFKVLKEVEVDISFVRIVAPLNDHEECEDGAQLPIEARPSGQLDILVALDTGQVQDWPAGIACKFHEKVVDQGSYYLLDADRNVVASLEGDYVPHGVVPGSYGDDIELDIDKDGLITNWPSPPLVREFFPSE